MVRKIGLLAVLVFFLYACGGNSDKNPQPNQTIVNYDTSITTGNLQVIVYDKSLNKIANADVYLYLSYDDIKRNLYVLYLKSSNNGLANFGYINTGNYYLISTAIVANVLKSDTGVVQVQSKRSIYKNTILK